MEKLIIFAVSLFAGVGLNAACRELGVSPTYSVVLGVIAVFAYPVLGALVVAVCGKLRAWAFPGSPPAAWTGEGKALLGAVWPICLVFWFVVAPFYAILNRFS